MDFTDPKIIAAASALIATLVSNLITARVFWWKRSAEIADQVADKVEERAKDRRVQSKTDLDAFRPYADPLSAASLSLYFRLNEIANTEGRSIYLNSKAPHSDYNEYKRWSTLYRMAAVLAWIRAFRREKSFIDIGLRCSNPEIEKSIDALEKALSEGPHIEDRRAREFASAISAKFNNPLTMPDWTRLSIQIENTLRSKLGSTRARSAHDLGATDQIELIDSVISDISPYAEIDRSKANNPAKREDLIKILGIKESWIFRDWQQAIGDFMIRETSIHHRAFDVIGYGDFIFEARNSLNNLEDKNHCWIRNLYNLFDDLNPSTVDIFDARQNQIRATLVALKTMNEAIEQQKNNYRDACQV